MTVGYVITELGMQNLDVDPRLVKRPSKDNITLNDVLSVLDPRFYKSEERILPVSDNCVAKSLGADAHRTEHLLDRLTKMGYAKKTGTNRQITNLSSGYSI
jgi:hypothetical protein